MDEKWKIFRKKGHAEMRPHIPGENMNGISVSDADQKNGYLDLPGGMIARDPQDHTDQWYVNVNWFNDHYDPTPME